MPEGKGVHRVFGSVDTEFRKRKTRDFHPQRDESQLLIGCVKLTKRADHACVPKLCIHLNW